MKKKKTLQVPGIDLNAAVDLNETNEFTVPMTVRPPDRTTPVSPTSEASENIMCHACGKDISHMNSTRRQQHINRCLDKQEESNKVVEMQKRALDKAIASPPDCPMCGKRFKTDQGRLTHLKKCAIDMKVPTEQLQYFVKKQEEEREKEREILRTGQIPSVVRIAQKTKSTTVKKKRKMETVESEYSEEMQVALAMSNSLKAQEEMNSSHLINHIGASRTATVCDKDSKKRRKKKGICQQVTYPLLEVSADEKSRQLAKNVNSILTQEMKTDKDTISLLPESHLQCPGQGQVSLWTRSNVGTETKDDLTQFYVSSLVPPIDISQVATGSKIKPMSSIPGRNVSILEQSMTSSKTSSRDVTLPTSADVDALMVSTQTAIVLAELATDIEVDDITAAADRTDVFVYSPEGCTQSPVGTTQNNLNDNSFIQQSSGFFVIEDRLRDENKDVARQRLAMDLSCLLDNSQYSDVTLVSCDGQSVSGHKVLIGARCPALIQMIEDDKIKLSVSYSTLLALLTYLYTAELKVNSDIKELLQLASLLNLRELIDLLEQPGETGSNNTIDCTETEHFINVGDGSPLSDAPEIMSTCKLRDVWGVSDSEDEDNMETGEDSDHHDNSKNSINDGQSSQSHTRMSVSLNDSGSDNNVTVTSILSSDDPENQQTLNGNVLQQRHLGLGLGLGKSLAENNSMPYLFSTDNSSTKDNTPKETSLHGTNFADVKRSTPTNKDEISIEESSFSGESGLVPGDIAMAIDGNVGSVSKSLDKTIIDSSATDCKLSTPIKYQLDTSSTDLFCSSSPEAEAIQLSPLDKSSPTEKKRKITEEIFIDEPELMTPSPDCKIRRNSEKLNNDCRSRKIKTGRFGRLNNRSFKSPTQTENHIDNCGDNSFGTESDSYKSNNSIEERSSASVDDNKCNDKDEDDDGNDKDDNDDNDKDDDDNDVQIIDDNFEFISQSSCSPTFKEKKEKHFTFKKRMPHGTFTAERLPSHGLGTNSSSKGTNGISCTEVTDISLERRVVKRVDDSSPTTAVQSVAMDDDAINNSLSENEPDPISRIDSTHVLERQDVSKEDSNTSQEIHYVEDDHLWDDFDDCGIQFVEMSSMTEKMPQSSTFKTNSFLNTGPDKNTDSNLGEDDITGSHLDVHHKTTPRRRLNVEQLDNTGIGTDEDVMDKSYTSSCLPSEREIESPKFIKPKHFVTPSVQNRPVPIKNWVPPSPFTPMQNYDNMNTPVLKREVQKYGVKPVGKKRMVKVLKDIYQQTHQYETDSECEDDVETEVRSQEPQTNQEEENSSSSESGLSDNLEESVQVWEDTDSDVSLSPQKSVDLKAKLMRFVKLNKELHTKILMYEPLDLEAMKQEMKDAGIKCGMEKLLEVIDEMNVTFSMKNSRNSSRGKGRAKKAGPSKKRKSPQKSQSPRKNKTSPTKKTKSPTKKTKSPTKKTKSPTKH